MAVKQTDRNKNFITSVSIPNPPTLPFVPPRIEEGTYGVVYRAREKATNQIVALKRLKMEKEKEGFPITSLREVNTLLKVRLNYSIREVVHQPDLNWGTLSYTLFSIVCIRGIVMHESKRLYTVYFKSSLTSIAFTTITSLRATYIYLLNVIS